jgi:hypothetical protein
VFRWHQKIVTRWIIANRLFKRGGHDLPFPAFGAKWFKAVTKGRAPRGGTVRFAKDFLAGDATSVELAIFTFVRSQRGALERYSDK